MRIIKHRGINECADVLLRKRSAAAKIDGFRLPISISTVIWHPQKKMAEFVLQVRDFKTSYPKTFIYHLVTHGSFVDVSTFAINFWSSVVDA